MHARTENQWGWLYVLPVVVLVAFNAVIPLMAVVNYSTQETFGNNVFFFDVRNCCVAFNWASVWFHVFL